MTNFRYGNNQNVIPAKAGISTRKNVAITEASILIETPFAAEAAPTVLFSP